MPFTGSAETSHEQHISAKMQPLFAAISYCLPNQQRILPGAGPPATTSSPTSRRAYKLSLTPHKEFVEMSI